MISPTTRFRSRPDRGPLRRRRRIRVPGCRGNPCSPWQFQDRCCKFRRGDADAGFIGYVGGGRFLRRVRVFLKRGLASFTNRVPGTGIVFVRLAGDFDRAEALLIALDILLKGRQKAFGVGGAGDDARSYLRLRRLRLNVDEVHDKFRLAVGQQGEVRINS